MLPQVLDIFEGKVPTRLFWLPPLSLGYIFTLSGQWIDFVLAVLSVGGVRLVLSMARQYRQNGEIHGFNSLSGWEQARTTIFGLIYFISIIAGITRLWMYFDHTNAIIVGFLGAYAGTAVVMLAPD